MQVNVKQRDISSWIFVYEKRTLYEMFVILHKEWKNVMYENISKSEETNLKYIFIWK